MIFQYPLTFHSSILNPGLGFDEEDDATRPMCGGGTDEGEGSDSSAIDSDEANAPLSASTSKPPKVVFSPSFRCNRSCRPPALCSPIWALSLSLSHVCTRSTRVRLAFPFSLAHPLSLSLTDAMDVDFSTQVMVADDLRQVP